MYNAFGVEHEPISKMMGMAAMTHAGGPKQFQAALGAVSQPKPTAFGAGGRPVTPSPRQPTYRPAAPPKPVGLKNKITDFTKRRPGTALGIAGGTGAALGYGASQYGGNRY